MSKLVFIRHAFPALSRPSLTTSVHKKLKLPANYTPFTVKNIAVWMRTVSYLRMQRNCMLFLAMALVKKRHLFDKDGNHDYVKAELKKKNSKVKSCKWEVYVIPYCWWWQWHEFNDNVDNKV